MLGREIHLSTVKGSNCWEKALSPRVTVSGTLGMTCSPLGLYDSFCVNALLSYFFLVMPRLVSYGLLIAMST